MGKKCCFNWQIWNTKAFSIYTTNAGEHVRKGQILACIEDCFEGIIVDEIYAPVEGTILFAHVEPEKW